MLLWIPGRLPGLNELLRDKATTNGRWNAYNELKCQWYGQIKVLVTARLVERQPPGHATFLFVEPSRRRDPDNILAGGIKLLLDSLVGCGVLAGDDWGNVLGLAGYWVQKSERAGCLVHWSPDGVLTKDAMVALLEKELERNDQVRKIGDGVGTRGNAGHRRNHQKATH